MKKIIMLFVSFLLIATAQAQVSASLDRRSIGLDESVNLTITVQGTINDDPNLDPLKTDFQVVGTSKSSQLSIVNGTQSRMEQWVVSLMPKKIGKLTVPAIKVGQETTSALSLQVNAAKKIDTHRDIFLEASIDPKIAYVGSQVTYVVKLYYGVNGLSGGLLNPDVPGGAEPMGNDTNYQVLRGTKPYNVIERHYVFFPDKPGTVTIPGVIFSGQIPMNARPGNNLDDLFQMTGGRPIRLSAKPVTLTVKEMPALPNGAQWLPAAKVTIKEYWSGNKHQWHVGEPITRTIEIIAEGLPANELPGLDLLTLPKVNLYPAQAQLNTVTDGRHVIGTRTEKTAFIPTAVGNLHFPPIEIPWFDVEKQVWAKATLPGHSVSILPAVAGAANTVPPAQSNAITDDTIVLPITSVAKTSKVVVVEPATTSSKWIIGLAILFALAWLITLLLWWRAKGGNAKSQPSVHRAKIKQAVTLKEARQSVREACNQNAAKALEKALIVWARFIFSPMKIRNLQQLIELPLTASFKTALSQLSDVLYRQHGEVCDGHGCWLAFIEQEQTQARQSPDQKKQHPELPPLNP